MLSVSLMKSSYHHLKATIGDRSHNFESICRRRDLHFLLEDNSNWQVSLM